MYCGRLPGNGSWDVARLGRLGAVVAMLFLAWPSGRLEALVVTEIMYHSDEPDDRPYEFIELYNETPDPLDLGGYTICNGVYFEFPQKTWLEGYSFLVVCARESEIRAKYGITNTIGDWYVGESESLSLANGGERIEICNPAGIAVCEVRYNDRGKWPAGADGTGHSLEIRSPYVEVDDPDSWELSNDLGGSPGRPNPCWGDVWGGTTPGSGGPVGIFTGHEDVGYPCAPGSASYSSATQRYTVSGSGADIWTGGDQFHFAYAKVDGAFDMKAHFVSKTWAPGSRWGKVGIMARQDLSSTSRYTMIQDHGEDLQDAARLATRPTHGGSDNVEEGVGTGAAHPAWVRVTRSGNVFRGYTSTDGTNWTQVGPNKDWGASAPAAVYLGLAVCSHQGCDLSTMVWDSVSITGTILPGEDPGGGDPPPEPGVCVPRAPVRLNEAYLLVAGDAPWVELYNAGESAVDLSGYGFTDDPSVRSKALLPAGTTIAAKGYLVLTEADLGFSLAVSAPGERKFLALTEAAGDHRVVDAFNFEPRYPGYSEARIPGDDKAFADGADPTPGAPNSMTLERNVVINEILYHPIDGDARKEFVELYNKGSSDVDISGWAFTDGIRFEFPAGTTIPRGGYLVVARDPARIREIYGLGPSAVLGPEGEEALARFGVLRDRGERVTLSDPWGRTVDTVRYHDGGDWPVWADGGGSSLELIDPEQDNRIAAAWDASDDSGKAETREYSYVARHVGGESELAILLLDRGIALVDDISVVGGGIVTTDRPLVEVGDVWKYWKGTEEPPAAWKDRGFDDSGWLSGPTGIGYGDADDETVLTDMQNGYLTVSARRKFQVADREAIDELIFSVVIDDGFYVYLNGTLVGSYNVTGEAYDAPASQAIEPTLVELDLSSYKNLLVNGENVLAARVHNANLSSSDLSFIPRLLNRTTTIGEGTEQLVNGTFETNARGWMIEGNHIRSGRTTQNPLSGSGSLKILATGRGDNKVNRIEAPEASGYGLGTLNPNEDVGISFKARWVVGSASILTHGYEHEMARSHALAVPENLGTPGAVNSVTLRQIAANGGNLGPLVYDVANEPAVPAAAESVTVTAKVIDSDGVASVSLYYSLNNPSASPTRVNMTLAEGVTYRAAIPGQSLGTRVVFYIVATDALGNVGRYPLDVRERSHPMLLNPPAATLEDLRTCVYRHDTPEPATPFLSYRFYMTQAKEDELSSRRLLSNDPLEGSFVFGKDDIYYGARMRFSGSPWARAGWGGSFRVYMPKDKPLHGRVKKFNLEDNQGNPLDARTRITHYLLRQSQGTTMVPYTDEFALVRWQVNARTVGIREHNWVPDRDFVNRWFPDDDEGDFLEMDDRFIINDSGSRIGSTDGRVLYPPPSSRSDGNGENKENYRWFFSLRAKRGADDFSNFIAFAKVMDPGRTPDAQFDQEIWRHANVEEFLRVFAIEFNIDDWDTWGCSRGKNCYFYRPTSDGRFHLFMWDVELTYGNLMSYLIPESPSSAFSPGGFSEVNRMVNRPEVRRVYYGILSEMVLGPNRWFHSDFVADFASRLARFGMGNTGIAAPGGYIDQKAALLAARIQSVTYPRVRLAITTNGGRDFSTAEYVVNLAGTSPVEVFQYLVNGEPFAARHAAMTSWAISGIPLVPGANFLEVVGLDAKGNVVDSDTITVTCTATWGPPGIDELDPAEAPSGADIRIRGSGFHDGLRVFFGARESSRVVYDESGPTPGEIIARVPAGSGVVQVTVRNRDLQVSNGLPFSYGLSPSLFVRGDANGDGLVDVSDPVKVLFYLFSGAATDCEDSLDADDDERIGLTDAVRVLDFLFRGGLAPAAPFPQAGTDPAGTELGCQRN